MGDAVFDRTDRRPVERLASGPDDEEFAHGRVEHQFGCDATVAACDDRGPWTLFVDPVLERIGMSGTLRPRGSGEEAGVPLPECCERLECGAGSVGRSVIVHLVRKGTRVDVDDGVIVDWDRL